MAGQHRGHLPFIQILTYCRNDGEKHSIPRMFSDYGYGYHGRNLGIQGEVAQNKVQNLRMWIFKCQDPASSSDPEKSWIELRITSNSLLPPSLCHGTLS